MPLVSELCQTKSHSVSNTRLLDPRAEGIVQDALRKASENKTTLVIAHKLATVKDADNIVLVSQGKVVEQGTHTELIAKDGRYAALVRAQDLGQRKEAEHKTEKQQDPSPTPTSHQESPTHLAVAPDQPPPDETLNKPLLACMAILFGEQKSMWKWFALALPATMIAGAASPAQAVLFSRLITVFTMPLSEGRERADFLSLMLFIVAIAVAIGYFVIGSTVNLVSFDYSLHIGSPRGNYPLTRFADHAKRHSQVQSRAI